MSVNLILGKKEIFKNAEPIFFRQINRLVFYPLLNLFKTDFNGYLPDGSERFFYGKWFFHYWSHSNFPSFKNLERLALK